MFANRPMSTIRPIKLHLFTICETTTTTNYILQTRQDIFRVSSLHSKRTSNIDDHIRKYNRNNLKLFY